MADSNTNINYSVEDIERYLHGKMNAQEMHDMENAALQDPFLADAIEGYISASPDETHKHLNEITAALQVSKEKTKVVPLKSQRFYWWKIAAIIILVIGAGVLNWFIINSNSSTHKTQELAHAKEQDAVRIDSGKEQSASTFGKTDTTSSTLLAQNKPETSATIKRENKNLERAKAVQLKRNDESAEEEAVAKQKIADSNSINQDAVADNLAVIPNQELLEKAHVKIPVFNDSTRTAGIAISPSNDKKYFFTNNNALNNFSGRITDTNNQPIPYATITASNNLAVTTDAKGYFRMQALDSSLKVTVASVGFVPETTQLKSTAVNFISIQPDENALNEIAVVGYSAKKKRNSNDSITAHPAGGWESFQAYVYKKLKKPIDTTSDVQITGNVQLEFSVDANGDPYNFSVLKSANEASATKAIDIIKEGPKWITTGRNKKGKVTIQF
jgi:outer membrane biosynthesis protein TonB